MRLKNLASQSEGKKRIIHPKILPSSRCGQKLSSCSRRRRVALTVSGKRQSSTPRRHSHLVGRPWSGAKITPKKLSSMKKCKKNSSGPCGLAFREENRHSEFTRPLKFCLDQASNQVHRSKLTVEFEVRVYHWAM
jgi:hypothetical protein